MDFTTNVGGIVDELDLEKVYDKSIIKFRFLDEISFYEQKRDHTKKYYNAFRFIVTTGSIVLPAILSMGQMDPAKLPKNFDMITYWASWTISLMVTGSNGFLQLFSLDKNYFAYSMVVEQLKQKDGNSLDYRVSMRIIHLIKKRTKYSVNRLNLLNGNKLNRNSQMVKVTVKRKSLTLTGKDKNLYRNNNKR